MKCLMKMQKVEEKKNEGNAKESTKSKILVRLGLSEVTTGWELERVPWHWLHKNSRDVNWFARQG